MKALALFSGGLDSILAVKLIQEQGIKIEGFYFYSNFFKSKPIETAKKLGIKLHVFKDDKNYIKVLKKPKHGYGSGINPCIDCKIFILKNAKKYMKKINAKFVVTGEVLGERPMSQYKKALDIIEKESGLKNYLLRPLTAKNLPETIPERKKMVNRDKLLAIKGRCRKPQMELAKKYNIDYYPTPGGGCLLTEKEFAKKVRDLFKYKKIITENDLKLLKLGRHFRQKDKIIVGRNEKENKQLLKLKNKSIILEVPNIGSPITLLQGKQAIEIAAKLTAYYSDSKDDKIKVKYGKGKLNKSVIVNQINKEEVDRLRI